MVGFKYIIENAMHKRYNKDDDDNNNNNNNNIVIINYKIKI
jgi:hypothetical protein